MELTKRQIQILKMLRDKPSARLERERFESGVYLVDECGFTTKLREATSYDLLRGGLVKNVGSVYYKSYTISPSGLRVLAKIIGRHEEAE